VENEQVAPSQAPREERTARPLLAPAQKALANLRSLCEEHLNGRCTIETVDVAKDFQAAIRDNILVTPALILVAPRPRVMVLGNLSDLPTVLAALRLSGSKS
jgi:circadian clock protein KaiB